MLKLDGTASKSGIDYSIGEHGALAEGRAWTVLESKDETSLHQPCLRSRMAVAVALHEATTSVRDDAEPMTPGWRLGW